jgi:1-acyl-sn-glycerol-3-phosphate acyltransferase
MLSFLPSPIVGAITFLLFCVNTVVWCLVLLVFASMKVVIPFGKLRRGLSWLLTAVAAIWIEGNRFIMRLTQKIHWDVEGLDNLSTTASYLVISNHRSWTDIPVLQLCFNHRIPFLKFFLKQELIWVPLLGLAWWALDFPFLKRYSRRFLEKHPELRGTDMETTRRKCAKFRHTPVSVMNFLEGTRFTREKHRKQQSSYAHLLLPKAGGVAMVLSNMGDYLSHILDVTIVYPYNSRSVRFWDLLSGRISTIVVKVRQLTVPEGVAGRDYARDDAYRKMIQQWVNRVWEDKDRQIDALLAAHAEPSANTTDPSFPV